MSTKMHALHSETQDFLGGWGVGFDPAGQSDIPDPALLEQINVLQSLNDLNSRRISRCRTCIRPAGYYMTTLGQESFRVDPWSFAQAMEANPLYPNWDTTNLTPAAYDNNTIEEDIYSAFVQAKFDGEIGGLATQTVVGLRYEQTDVEANAQQNVVDRFLWTSDNDFQRVFGTDLVALGD